MDNKVARAADNYRLARHAIWVLGAHLEQTNYQLRYPVLLPSRVRNLDEPEHEAYEAERDVEDSMGVDEEEIDVGDLPKRLPKKKAKPKKGTDPEAGRSETYGSVSWIWRRSAHGMVESMASGGVRDDLHEGKHCRWPYKCMSDSPCSRSSDRLVQEPSPRQTMGRGGRPDSGRNGNLLSQGQVLQ